MAEIKNGKIKFSYESILNDLFEFHSSFKSCKDAYFSQKSRKMFHEIQELLVFSIISRVIFIGNDFNHFGSIVAMHCLNTASKPKFRFNSEFYEASEFYDYVLPRKRDDDTLFILLSKSGQSKIVTKIVDQLHLLKIDKKLMWFVTNSPESINAKHFGFVFPTYVKSEIVHGTKTFQNTVFILYLISQLLLGRDPLNEENSELFENMAQDLSNYKLKHLEISKKVIEFLGKKFKFLYYISRGVSQSTANNSALLSISLFNIFSESISLGQILPRSIEVSSDNVRCIFLINNENGEFMENLPSDINAISNNLGRTILITNNNNLASSVENNSLVLPIKYHCDLFALSPIFESIIIQSILIEYVKSKELII